MMWRLIGDVYETDTPGKLQSDDGLRVTGSPNALDAFNTLMRDRDTIELGYMGAVVDVDPADPVAVYAVALAVMRGPDITGDPPALPAPEPIPDGAIA